MHSAEAERDLGHLKRLLLVDERREIETLRREMSALDGRLGSDKRFSRAVADSIVVALKVAEIEQHRELAGVMAPIVVAGIRREIAESKDVMVGALYPIVGRLVATAVAQALRQLAEDVNRRIETVLSPRSLRLRFKALLTRRPLADLVLSAALQDRIDTLLLLDRASGAVLASSVVRDGRIEAEARATDSLDLLGGLMAAIIEFANHALSDSHGELRTLDFGGRTALLRASPLYVVAATGCGPMSAGLGTRVDEAFLTFLEAQPDDAAAALATMHGRFLPPQEPKPWNRRISALTLIGPALAALLACGVGAGWLALHERVEEAGALARIAQAPELAGYPLSLAIDRERGTLAVTALAPNPSAWDAVRRRIEHAFPNLRVDERVAILSDAPEVKQIRDILAAGEAQAVALRERLDSLAAARREGEAALAALVGRIDRIEHETAAALAQRPSRTEVAQAGESQAVALGDRLDRLWTRFDAFAPSLEALEAGRKQGEAASHDALSALVGRIGRIEHETGAALAQRPSRTEVVQAGESQAVALGDRLDRLSTRLDAFAPSLEALEAGRKREEAASHDALSALVGRIERVERETEAELSTRPLRAEVARGSETMDARLAELSTRFDTPRRRLLDTVERTAIFFKDDAVYREPAKAAAALEKLAVVLRAEPGARLRVVGFADSLGTPKANLKIGRLRADKVAADLVHLGIDPARLRAVGVSQAVPLSDDVGGASANRRVAFEPVFTDE